MRKYGEIFIHAIHGMEPQIPKEVIKPEQEPYPVPQNISHMQQQKELHANAYAKWNEHEDKELERLYKQGFQIRELSIIFQRNEGSIRSRLHKLGLSK